MEYCAVQCLPEAIHPHLPPLIRLRKVMNAAKSGVRALGSCIALEDGRLLREIYGTLYPLHYARCPLRGWELTAQAR